MQVRLRLVSASICHTDLWVWQGEDRGMMAPFPMILGHEGASVSKMGSLPFLSSTFTWAGEVEAIGEGVSGLQVS